MNELERINTPQAVKDEVLAVIESVKRTLANELKDVKIHRPLPDKDQSEQLTYLLERYVERTLSKAIKSLTENAGKIAGTQKFTRNLPAGTYRINGTKRIMDWDGTNWTKNGEAPDFSFKVRTVESV